MTPTDLDELERLHAAATPGPFIYGASTADEHAYVAEADGTIVCYVAAPDDAQSDALAEHIHALLVNAPSLLRELRARRRQVEEARMAFEWIGKGSTAPGHNAKTALAALRAIEAEAGEAKLAQAVAVHGDLLAELRATVGQRDHWERAYHTKLGIIENLIAERDRNAAILRSHFGCKQVEFMGQPGVWAEHCKSHTDCDHWTVIPPSPPSSPPAAVKECPGCDGYGGESKADGRVWINCRVCRDGKRYERTPPAQSPETGEGDT